MKVIRNPVTDHLPIGCIKIGTSFSTEKLVKPVELVKGEQPVAIVVGAMAHGKVRQIRIKKSFTVTVKIF